MNNCPVCDMTVSTNANKPFKAKGGRGTITYESTYCSRYCREYDERNMEKEPISDSKHHKGIFGFPPIEVPCEMCSGTVTLKRTNYESASRHFCSTDCFNKLKSAKGRKVYVIWRVLSTMRHFNDKLGIKKISPQQIMEIINNDKLIGIKNDKSLRGVLNRWMAAGLITKDGSHYNYHKDGLRGKPLGLFIYDYLNMSYAERMAFLEQ